MGDVAIRKILYISGTRADYGLIESVLEKIDQHPKLGLEIVATGMHLMEEFGYTVKDIKKSFRVHNIDATYEKDDKESMAHFIGIFISVLTQKIKDIKPDIILLLGDRGEMLAGAIVGAYLTIPVAHLHGGEVTSTVDEISRHAITKLAHIHLVATIASAERVIKMGEEPWRVHIVGAPGLDKIVHQKLIPKREVFSKLRIDPSKVTLLVIQHPVTSESEGSGEQMTQLMEAIGELGYQTVLIYPNADAGGRRIIGVIKRYEKLSFIHAYPSIERCMYVSLMRYADVMVGNSSSGIIEAPSLGLPVVNVGSRQNGRERGKNIIDAGYGKSEIMRAIKKALTDERFLRRIKRCETPYGDGNAGARIVDILSKLRITSRLIQKKITY